MRLPYYTSSGLSLFIILIWVDHSLGSGMLFMETKPSDQRGVIDHSHRAGATTVYWRVQYNELDYLLVKQLRYITYNHIGDRHRIAGPPEQSRRNS